MTKSSPFTYSIASILDLDSSKDNFLATQVWPSARVAAQALLKYNPYDESKQWIMCEFGCGPGLPSLAAAHTTQYSQVVATDVDEFCLELVQAAAEDQGLGDIVKTQVLDLTRDPADLLSFDDDVKSLENRFSGGIKVDIMANEHSPLPSLSYDWIKDIDLFVMADIFENAQVAKGAAAWTKFLLQDLRNNDCSARDNDALAKNTNIGEQSSTNQNTKGRKALEKRPRIWVFAQSDRAQREIYLESLREVYDAQDLKWLPLDECSDDSYLWLVDLEETEVQYG